MYLAKDPPPAIQVLKSLEVLHLAYNGIVDLIPLQLGKIPSLRALFLQGILLISLCKRTVCTAISLLNNTFR